MKTRVCVLVFASTVFAVGVVQSATYYVDVNYDGSQGAPNGATNRPYTAITNAIVAANAVAGSTVLVADGVYKSTLAGGLEDFGTDGVGITESTTLKGGYVGQVAGGTFDWTDGSRVPRSTIVDLTNALSRAVKLSVGNKVPTLDGFTYRNASNALQGAAVYASGVFGSGMHVRNCLFTNNVTTGGVGGGGLSLTVNNAQGSLRDCEFVQNRATDGGAVYLSLTSPQGLWAYSNNVHRANSATDDGGAILLSGSTVMRNCGFSDNTAVGTGGAIDSIAAGSLVSLYACTFTGNACGVAGAAISGDAAFAGIGIYMENCLVATNTGGYALVADNNQIRFSFAVQLIHCSLADNPGGGVWNNNSNAAAETNRLRVVNCVVARNGAVGLRSTKGTVPCEYNDVFGHTTSNYWGVVPGANDLSSDPLFMGVADYRLQWSSPCVNSATNLGIAVDLVDVARPQHLGVDRGCYESLAPATIETRPASNVLAGSADLNGYLATNGTSPTSVTVYWGAQNGGTTAWANTNALGPVALGGVSTNISTLAPDTAYYFRYQASNALGEVWAETTETFMTSEIAIETIAHAAEAGLQPGTVVVHRASAATGAAVRVTFTVGGTATAGVNYVSIGTNVIFQAGESNAFIAVTPINDTANQQDTTVTVTLVSGPYRLGTPVLANVVIANVSPQTVSLTATDAAADEEFQDTGAFTFTRSGYTNDAVTVYYTVSGTATATDYAASAPLSGSIILAAGQTSSNVSITPVLDWYDEGAGETLTLAVAAGSYDTGTPATGTVTIVDYNYAAFSTFHVDVTWTNDNGLGTSTNPARTVTLAATAINQIGGGKTLAVADGAYSSLLAGGLESFGTGGVVIAQAAVLKGGYAGWGTGTNFDWSEGARVPCSTVVDLTGAASRALWFATTVADVTLDGVRFQNASNALDGAAVYKDSSYDSGITIRDCLFTNNFTTGVGGGANVYGNFGPLLVDNCVFVSNRAAQAGALYAHVSVDLSTITNCQFRGNVATDLGGALYVQGTTRMSLCDIVGNRANGTDGGGIYASAADLTFLRCTIVGNTAAGTGGALYGSGFSMGAVSLENVLVAGNTGTWSVYHYGFSVPLLALRHCTLADNPGDGLFADSDLSIQNCIVAGNGAKGIKTDDPTPVCNYNDVVGHSTANYEGLSAGANDISADPKFEGAGDYHIRVNSPCSATAANLGVVVDLDGVVRPFGSGVDMGCYEAPTSPGSLILVH